MDQHLEGQLASFEQYIAALGGAMGHLDRVGPMRDYCTGLLMPGERKSVEPMAAVTAPARVPAQHQSLLHLVGQAPWSDEAVLAKVRDLVVPAIERSGPIEAWIVDDTGFAKKGIHSVGVARQYCGRLGKTDNCQIAVTLSVANHFASLPIACRLYLPEIWVNDALRRAKAHVPEDIMFRTKPQIALEQIAAAKAAGVAGTIVLADAGYGCDGEFRAGLTAMGFTYALGVQSTLSVWPPGMEPLPPKPWSGRGRKSSRMQRDADHAPVSAKDLALGLPAQAWCEVEWREGSNAPLSSRFAAVRLRPASRDWKRHEPHPFEWLLIEWPEGEKEPAKYFLSTLPEGVSLEVLVDAAKMRWRIERDYEELKSELGLAHFEGRSWRGFHHHATLCIAAYGFLIRQRADFSPSNAGKSGTSGLSSYRRPVKPTSPARAPRPKFHSDSAENPDRRPGKNSKPMPVLPHNEGPTETVEHFVTQ